MKMTKIKIQPVRATMGVLLLALVSACATVAPTQDEIIAERVQARWDALIARDYAKAYSYYSPAYRSRSTAVDLEIKLRMQRVKWIGAKYVSHSCSGDVCTVDVDLKYQMAKPVPGVSSWGSVNRIQEQWIKVDGQWWFVPPKD
jgi:hypothetical protein